MKFIKALVMLIAFSITYNSVYAETKIYFHSPKWTNMWGKIFIDDTQGEVKGILVWHGDPGLLEEPHKKIAFDMGLAYMNAGYFWGFTERSQNAWNEIMERLAEKSGRPELLNAPMLVTGHSQGGEASSSFAKHFPEKTIAFTSHKNGGMWNTTPLTKEQRDVPGLLIEGQGDSSRDSLGMFKVNSKEGAPWAWAMDYRSGHSRGRGNDLIIAYFKEIVNLRLPRDQSPAKGPVKLKTIKPEDGWLVDVSTTMDSDMVKIKPYDKASYYTENWGWVPSKRMAHIVQAFTSLNRPRLVGISGSINKNRAPTLTLNVDLPNRPWKKVEFFEGDNKVGEVKKTGNENKVTFSYENPYKGHHQFTHYAIIHENGGKKWPTAISTSFNYNPNSVVPKNVAPIAYAGTNQVVTDADGNGKESITLNGGGSIDRDGKISSYIWKKGSVQIAKGINPTVNLAVGSHTITLTVTDNGGKKASDLVSVTVKPKVIVKPKNTAPVAKSQKVVVNQDSTMKITLIATDADGDRLGYWLPSRPKNGSFKKNGNVVTYTPNKGFSGNDSFSFRASDGKAHTKAATVSITVKPKVIVPPKNTAPVAKWQKVLVDKGSSIKIKLFAKDADGDKLRYMTVARPRHGSYSKRGNVVTYTPNKGYSGNDRFTFRVNDGKVNSKVAVVSITVKDPEINGSEDVGVKIGAAEFDGESHADNDFTVRKENGAITYIFDGSWVRYNSFDFGTGVSSFEVMAASPFPTANQKVELRIGSADGQLIGEVKIQNTGGSNSWQSFRTDINKKISGVHDLYFVFVTGGFNLKDFIFDNSLGD